MSYGDLINYYPDIQDQWKVTYKSANDFLNLIKEKSELDKNYAKNLEKLVRKYGFDNLHGDMKASIDLIRDILLSRVSLIRGLSSNLFNDVVYPLKKLLAEQNLGYTESTNICKNVLNDIQNNSTRLEKLREKYVKSCKYYEDVKGTPKEPQAYKTELEQLKAYNSAIEEHNSALPVLVQLFKRSLVTYQKQEEDRYAAVKNSMVQFIQYESFHIKSLHIELQEITESIENYNPKNDIALFIANHSKPRPRLFPEPAINREIETSGQASNDYIMNDYIQKLWSGTMPQEEETARFLKQIKRQEGRKAWSSSLNRCRSMGKFEIPKDTFEFAGDCMLKVLDVMLEEKDYKIAGSCIILSDSFYEAESNPKKFLHFLIINHSIWQDHGFWKEIIEETIKNVWQEYYKNGGSQDAEVLKNIAIAQITSYVHTMKLFNLSNDFIMQAAEEFGRNYHLDEEFTNSIGESLK